MTAFYFAAGLFILLTIAGGLVRVLRGPGSSDRLMAAQLSGSGGVAVLLLLAAAMGQTAIIDVALMLGILAVFASVGFVTWRSDGNG
ncbi:multiple resistance and pH regulation protein F [Aestuariivirga litoralis]|uniref:Multiple resistance and pH regulation protein F n=1 Tax=Aestuariivirga litoralis TaxID=2650924 RepID=A0A2W2BN84_9HYPH|nr:monovalent cation/H+ antiporter complex subunit F [Aestuariivirga litoralis]PZF77307.1 multiple resistance and pH regulation protein F [Aestuariivirga litoralis]